jgi:hypothetical protein
VITFTVVLCVRLATELAGRYGENSYLTAKPWRAAVSTTLSASAGIMVARAVIADGNNYAAAATLAAVFIATVVGCRDLERRS